MNREITENYNFGISGPEKKISKIQELREIVKFLNFKSEGGKRPVCFNDSMVQYFHVCFNDFLKNDHKKIHKKRAMFRISQRMCDSLLVDGKSTHKVHNKIIIYSIFYDEHVLQTNTEGHWPSKPQRENSRGKISR